MDARNSFEFKRTHHVKAEHDRRRVFWAACLFIADPHRAHQVPPPGGRHAPPPGRPVDAALAAGQADRRQGRRLRPLPRQSHHRRPRDPLRRRHLRRLRPLQELLRLPPRPPRHDPAHLRRHRRRRHHASLVPAGHHQDQHPGRGRGQAPAVRWAGRPEHLPPRGAQGVLEGIPALGNPRSPCRINHIFSLRFL